MCKTVCKVLVTKHQWNMVSSLERAQNRCSGNPSTCLSSFGSWLSLPWERSRSQGGFVQPDTDYVTDCTPLEILDWTGIDNWSKIRPPEVLPQRLGNWDSEMASQSLQGIRPASRVNLAAHLVGDRETEKLVCRRRMTLAKKKMPRFLMTFYYLFQAPACAWMHF